MIVGLGVGPRQDPLEGVKGVGLDNGNDCRLVCCCNMIEDGSLNEDHQVALVYGGLLHGGGDGAWSDLGGGYRNGMSYNHLGGRRLTSPDIHHLGRYLEMNLGRGVVTTKQTSVLVTKGKMIIVR